MTLTFDQLPFVFQIETLVLTEWWSNAGVRTSYQQLEDAMKKEMVALWETGTYNRDNITEHLVYSSDSKYRGDRSLNRLSTYKRTSKFGEGVDNQYRGGNGRYMPLMNEVYQKQVDKNQQLQTQLTQTQQQVNQQQQTITNLSSQATNLNQLQSQLTAAQLQNTQLQKEKEALQKQLNQYNVLLGITSQEQSQTTNPMVAQVQQASDLLPPGGK